MPEYTSIVTEAYISGAWANISADIRVNPPPRVSGIGILDNTFIARTGDIGTYEFTLDNSASNSGGVLGYYTPHGQNVRTGWDVNIPIRLTISYEGYSRVKFYGTIDLDGISVETGKYRGRTVAVRASNWMAHAAKHKINLLDYQTNVRGDQAVQCLIDNVDIKPPNVRMEEGYVTFPTMFDITKANTTAMAEFQKIAMSELGYIYQTGDGTLEFMPFDGSRSLLSNKYVPATSDTSTDKILKETGGTDGFLLEDSSGDILMEQRTLVNFTAADDKDNMVQMSVSYGKEMGNYVKAVTYPRDVDASAVVLWSLEEPIEILAGETLSDIRGAYRDPSNPDIKLSGINMVIPVSGTDYAMFQNADGTGTDRTADLTVVARYGTGEASYDLTNNNAATSYITILQARGYGVHIEQESVKSYRQTTSIASYGVMPLTLNFPYLAGVTDLFNVADKTPATAFGAGGFLRGLDEPTARIDQVDFVTNKDSRMMLAFMFCEPSDTMAIYETVTDGNDSGTDLYSDAKTINGYSFEIINGKTIKWSVVLKRTGFHA